MNSKRDDRVSFSWKWFLFKESLNKGQVLAVSPKWWTTNLTKVNIHHSLSGFSSAVQWDITQELIYKVSFINSGQKATFTTSIYHIAGLGLFVFTVHVGKRNSLPNVCLLVCFLLASQVFLKMVGWVITLWNGWCHNNLLPFLRRQEP